MTRTRYLRELRKERYDRACWWLERGVAVVPIKPWSKRLQPGYGPRSAQITDIDFARKWFLNTDANLGIVLGGRSGLIVADWDDVRDYGAWRGSAGRLVDTLAEQTARGYHLFFYAKDLPSAAGNGCEFKAKGICIVSPSTHPSGIAYRIANDAPIATLGAEQACELFPFLSEALADSKRRRRRGAKTLPVSIVSVHPGPAGKECRDHGYGMATVAPTPSLNWL